MGEKGEGRREEKEEEEGKVREEEWKRKRE